MHTQLHDIAARLAAHSVLADERAFTLSRGRPNPRALNRIAKAEKAVSTALTEMSREIALIAEGWSVQDEPEPAPAPEPAPEPVVEPETEAEPDELEEAPVDLSPIGDTADEPDEAGPTTGG